ncbi:MAG: hypothetical protein HQM13_21435 [SAR324 cluster bacterium]|nr:hypothetical protein [SAR324 cluster bacterium]
MEGQNNFISFLEMLKRAGITAKALKNNGADIINLGNGIEIEFGDDGSLKRFHNQYNHEEQTKRFSSLMKRIGAYFTNLFPKLGEEQFESTEKLIEEGLILAKYVKSDYQDEDLWKRLKFHFIEKYPHLASNEMTPFSVITHALVLSEDERIRKKNTKRKPR